MRRMVGVLRRPDEAPALAPQPSLEHIEKLVAHARETGLPVELRIEGTPVQLPPGIDTTAYRIVQEALTNAVKHARARAGRGASSATRTARVELTVSDDGRGGGDGGGSGHGLVGMRERVSVYGGELEAGPQAGRRLPPPCHTPHHVKPGRERHHHTHLPVQRRRGIDGAPAPAARRLQRRDGRPRAAAARGLGRRGGPRARRRRRLVLRRVSPAAPGGRRSRGRRSERWPRTTGPRESTCASGSACTRARRRRRATSTSGSPSTAPRGSATPATAGRSSLSETTRSLLEDEEAELDGLELRDLGHHLLKDFDRPVRIYQLAIHGLPAEFPRAADRGRRRCGAARRPPGRARGDRTSAVDRRRSRARADRRRPGARPHRLPDDPRGRARHRGRRRGGGRPGGADAGAAPQAGRRPDGRPHARARRDRGDAAAAGRRRRRRRRS